MKNISVNIRPKKTGDNILLLAWISTGQSHIDHHRIYEYHNRKTGEIYKPEKGEQFTGWDPEIWEQRERVKKVYDYLIMSTGLSVSKHFWNENKKLAKAPYEYINTKVDEFKKHVEELYTSMKKDNPVVSHEKLKEQIEQNISSVMKATNRMYIGQLKKSKTKSDVKSTEPLPVISIPTYFGGEYGDKGIRTNFIDYITYKINEYTLQGPYVSGKGKSTITSYKNLKQVLQRYIENTSVSLDIRNFTIEHCQGIISWLIKTGQNLPGEPYKPYSQNYCETVKKNIHSFLVKASEDDDIPLHPKAKLNNDYWDNKWLKQNDPFLSYEQIDKLKKLKFGKKSAKEIEMIQSGMLKYVEETTLEICRNYFVVNCDNGYRFSDFERMTHLYKFGDTYYYMNTSEKTDTPTKKPVRDQWIIDLYEKTYNKEFNFPVTEQCYNRAIKVLCFRAGFTEPVLLYAKNLQTGERNDSNKPLWSCCTSKTARKSMVTNEIFENFTPMSTVASWSGHGTETSLRNYLQLTPAQYAAIAERTYQMLLEARKLRL